MRLEPLAGRWFRLLTPRWAHAPLSGDGAAITGGRLNRPRQRALYLSEDLRTAWAEYQQAAYLPRPGTIAVYEVQAVRVADLDDPAVAAEFGIGEEDLRCVWRQLWRIERREPPTWSLADRLITAGAQGALYRSVVHPAGRNLVLWQDGPAMPAEVTVIDPHGDLPRDAASWRG